MKKASDLAAQAFKLAKKRELSNTSVLVKEGEVILRLFGNIIARRLCRTKVLILNDCGWNTVTTKDRLNAVLTHYSSPVYIKQVKGVWHLSDGREWKCNEDNLFNFEE